MSNLHVWSAIIVIVIVSTTGDVLLSRAMKQIGEVNVLQPRAVFGALWRVLRIASFWTGLVLMSLAFFCLLALLSWENVSVVVPATALTYVVAALGGRFLLHEEVAPIRWDGVVLVCVGVALLSLN